MIMIMMLLTMMMVAYSALTKCRWTWATIQSEIMAQAHNYHYYEPDHDKHYYDHAHSKNFVVWGTTRPGDA